MSSKVFVRDATGVVREFSSWDSLFANLAQIQTGLPGFYVFLTAWIFPGWDVPTVFLISLIPVVAHATLLSIMGSQFPRSGADYVWASRIIHPSLVMAPFLAWIILTMLVVPSFMDWGIYGGIGTILANLSIAMNRPDLVDVARTVASPNVRFGTVSAILVIFFVLNMTRLNWTRKWISAMGIVGAVAGAVAGISLLTVSHEAFVANWNTHFGSYMTYDSIIQTALDNGYGWVPIGAGTFAAFFGVFAGAYEMSIGYQASVSFAGEIKNAKRSVPFATLGAVAIASVVLFVMVWTMAHVIGQQFVFSAMYLYYSRPDLWAVPFAADPFFFATVATGLNPILAFIIPLGLLGGALGLIPIVYITTSRYLLGMSFDRSIPGVFSSVSERFHTPWIGLLACFIVYEIGLAFSTYWAAGVVYIGLPYRSMTQLSIIVVAASGLLFPLLRKDMYKKSEFVVRHKWALAISSLVTLGFFAFAVPLVLSHPEYGGPSNLQVTLFYVGLLLAGFVIWFASKAYWKTQGINISGAFKEIPPE